MKQNLSEHDNARYKRATRIVLKRYMREIKNRWRTSIPGLLLPSVNNILLVYVPPLILTAIVQSASDGNRQLSDFLPYVGLFALAYLGGEVIMRIGIHNMIKTEVGAVKTLYTDGLSQLLERDLDFFHNNFAGSLTKKTIAYAHRFIDMFDTLAFNVSSKVLPIGFAAIVLSLYSPWLALCLLAWVALGVAVAYPLIKKRLKLVTIRETAGNVVSGHVADIYGNVDAVRAHATERAEESRNALFVLDYSKKLKKSWDFQNWVVDVAIAPIYILTNVSGLLLGLHLAQQGVIEYTALIVVFTYYMAVTNFMWEFNAIYRRLESAFADAAQFTELLLTKPTILDPAKPQFVSKPRGALQFNNVVFTYNKEGDPLFDDFTLRIAAGEKIGLVGRSGGGKTSITKLLLRFVDIDDGTITIDGVETKEMTQEHLRSLISYVPQDPVMFHRTIADNIAYGKADATQAEIVAAAKKAHAHEFIERLTHGYDTLVGERGIKLSGGQRQRIAIARAILRDAPILLLDEATSALDSESEKLIQDALQKLMKGKTTIVIAHRLSTIQKMDRIIVLDKGAIIESGTHTELNTNDGVYAELWKHQTGGFIEE